MTTELWRRGQFSILPTCPTNGPGGNRREALAGRASVACLEQGSCWPFHGRCRFQNGPGYNAVLFGKATFSGQRTHCFVDGPLIQERSLTNWGQLWPSNSASPLPPPGWRDADRDSYTNQSSQRGFDEPQVLPRGMSPDELEAPIEQEGADRVNQSGQQSDSASTSGQEEVTRASKQGAASQAQPMKAGNGALSTVPWSPFTGLVERQRRIVQTESNVRRMRKKRPESECVICDGSGKVECERCCGRGRLNRTELAMLPKGEWPQWCWSCRGSGLAFCNRCLGTGERRGIIGFRMPEPGDPEF